MADVHYIRNEDDASRFDRHWSELLQELRLAQTGTQILFAFLLAIAFTTPLREADDFVHVIFAVTLILTAMATALLLAPVSLHRMTFQRRLRHRMVPVAAAMASAGMFLLLLAMCGSLILALDVVFPRSAAVIVAAGALLWFIVFWYVIGGLLRRKR